MSRRRSLVKLMAATAVLGLGGLGGVVPDAQAQEAVPGEELFGSYELEARGIGIETSYEIEGLLPGGSPVLDLTIPETLARFGSGPTGYGLASLAYPGGLVVNLPSLLEQMGQDGSQIPPYPIKAEAFFPAGPTEVDESQPGGIEQYVVSGDLGVESAGSFPAVVADPAVSIASVASASRTSIEGKTAVSRTRIELGGIKVLGGLIAIESIVTDLVAVHDGTNGTTDGHTAVGGVTFLGLAASLTEDGLVLDDAPPVTGPAAPLGGLLDPVTGPLKDVTEPVQDLLAQVLAQATPQLDGLLAQAGITIELVQPKDVQVDSGASSRSSSGVSITFSYLGREQVQLGELLASIPDELKPSLGPIPNPVTFLAENHIVGLNLAPGSVSALASPPFEVLPLPPVDTPATDPGSFDPGSFSAPSFATPLPEIPAGGDGDGGPLDAEDAANAFGGAVPALLVVLALLASPFFGVGSTKLADNVLAPVSTSCPTGHDKPLPARPS